MAGLEIEALWTPEEGVVGHSHTVTIGDLPADAEALSAVWQRLVAAKTPPTGGPTQQEITTAIRDIGMVPVAAHPFQVLTNVNCHGFSTGTEGLRGMEMWYATLPNRTEQGIEFYIQRVAAGEPAMVTSSCDYHRRIQVYLGSLKCVTWVYAEELTPAGIQAADICRIGRRELRWVVTGSRRVGGRADRHTDRHGPRPSGGPAGDTGHVHALPRRRGGGSEAGSLAGAVDLQL